MYVSLYVCLFVFPHLSIAHGGEVWYPWLPSLSTHFVQPSLTDILETFPTWSDFHQFKGKHPQKSHTRLLNSGSKQLNDTVYQKSKTIVFACRIAAKDVSIQPGSNHHVGTFPIISSFYCSHFVETMRESYRKCFWRRLLHLLDRCHTCDFVAQLYRTTLSQDKVAVCNCACRTLQLCRINKNWPMALVENFVARYSCATKLQVWHRSYNFMNV